MAALRDPETGCPWDLEQDFSTIAPYTIEEAYEVADAIEREAWDELQDELGDLLEIEAANPFRVRAYRNAARTLRGLGREVAELLSEGYDLTKLPGIGKGQVQILGGVSLGAREKAVLLSVEGHRLLVGIAPGRVQTLLVLADDESPVPGFAEQLDGASRRADGEAVS